MSRSSPKSRRFLPKLENLEDRAVPASLSFDHSFGTLGQVRTQFPVVGSTTLGEVRAMVIQPADGKIIAVGEVYTPQGADFAVARYDTNGVPDHGFSFDGLVTTDFGGQHDDQASAVVLQNDGKIVVAGTTHGANGAAFAVARYNTDGGLDLKFGVNGKVVLNPSGSDDVANGLALLQGGSFLVAGYHGTTVEVVRLYANGTRDLLFGGINATAKTNLGGLILGNQHYGTLAVQPIDGKIVVAAETQGNASQQVTLVRYKPNGTLDTTFGVNGIASVPVGVAPLTVHSLAVQQDGRLLVGGRYNGQTVLVRFLGNGGADSDFDGDGVALGTGQGAEGVDIRPTGTIVVAGGHTVERFQPDGVLLDMTYSQVFQGTDFRFHALAVQSDGKVVTGGAFFYNVGQTPARDFFLARYVVSVPNFLLPQNDPNFLLPQSKSARFETAFNQVVNVHSHGMRPLMRVPLLDLRNLPDADNFVADPHLGHPAFAVLDQFWW